MKHILNCSILAHSKRILILLCISVAFVLSQETWNFQLEGYTRSCIVYFPSSKIGQANLPVLFALHGYGGSATNFRNNRGIQLFGDSQGFITIYPNAVNGAWNSGISDYPGMITPNVDDVGFISRIIDSLVARFKIDSSRVYSCGFSNGGFMSLKLAGLLSHRIAAVGSVGGVMTPSTSLLYTPIRPVPILMINGTADNDVPYITPSLYWFDVDSTVRFLRRKNNCSSPPESLRIADRDPNDGSTVDKFIYRSSTTSSEIVLYRVNGGGHSWPRFNATGTTTNRDIEATAEIWDFVKRFTTTNITMVPEEKTHEDLQYELSQNYPNPFNPTTTIRYAIPSSAHVKLTVYNMLGQVVSELVNEEQSAGWKEVEWNAKDVSRQKTGGQASGIYFYKMTAGSYVEIKKMQLVK